MQARSNARVESLLDATAAIVDEIGYERLTTAHVAERAGASIGTLYRYYPDRLAVLYALRSRLLQRYLDRLDSTVDFDTDPDIAGWASSAIDAYIDLYRTEPGFRAIRFGDVVDEKVQGYAGQSNGVVARHLVDSYRAVHGTRKYDELVYHVEVVVEACEALAARAFSMPGEAPDERFIGAMREFVEIYLTRHVPA